MVNHQAIYNKLTKPLRDSKIKEILSNIDYSKAFPTDEEFTFQERILVKQELIEIFIPWVKEYFEGLNSFNFKYVTNGNSDAVNMIFMHRDFKRVCFLKNEYSYYSHICTQLNLNHLAIDEKDIDFLTKDDLFLMREYFNNQSVEEDEKSNKLRVFLQRRPTNPLQCAIFVSWELKSTVDGETRVRKVFEKRSNQTTRTVRVVKPSNASNGEDATPVTTGEEFEIVRSRFDKKTRGRGGSGRGGSGRSGVSSR